MSAEGTPAARFALEHAHYTEDLAFWLARARDLGGPVLDLGAAAGRVSLHLATHGVPVTAVDIDEAMIDEIERAVERTAPLAAVRAVRGDLRDLDLGERFGLVLLPMNTLQAFLDRDDQLAVLRGARRHVTDGGEFAFDVVMADLDLLAGHLGEIQDGARHHVGELTLAHRARFDAVDVTSGTVRFTQLIDETGGDATRTYERPHTVHLFSPSELWELIADAGLAVKAVYGDFDGSPLQPDSERQVYRCGVAT